MIDSELLIYTHKITSRNKFVFNLFFRDVLHVKHRMTSDAAVFKNYLGAKFSYTLHPLENELFFLSKNLLFEMGIKEQAISIYDWEGSKIFFPTGKNSALPFDPFAAAFYLVSRYEEYLPHIRDRHDRFDAKESLAFQNNFLDKPLVNTWAKRVKQIILGYFPDFHFPESTYHFVSTIDIDNAYAYREKGLVRSIGAYFRAIVKGDFAEISERTKVLFGKQHDPYDTYAYQLEIQKKYKFRPIYFFLLGDYAANDKNIQPENKKFQSLIKELSDYADVGIHPSYNSADNIGKIKKEVGKLSKIVNQEITKSRQHFLRLKFPETYRNLIDIDITDDYTMGYADYVGFRASICTPFHFYDLDMETETRLVIHPFAVMECTLKQYMNIAPEEAMNYIKPLIDAVKSVDGVFIMLWHNETLSDAGIWKNWRQIYEDAIVYALEKK
ncbi:MAG: polysaccharide deacetylase family protein [Bacteroidia bacterium]